MQAVYFEGDIMKHWEGSWGRKRGKGTIGAVIQLDLKSSVE